MRSRLSPVGILARAHLAVWPLLVATLALLMLGCPAKLPDGATALDEVRVIKEGDSDEVEEDDIIDAIASDPTHKTFGLVRMWWIDYGVYDKVIVEKDLQRVQRFYRARGYYEAQVRAGRVVSNGDRAVKVEIIVDEGPVVTVGTVQEIGIEPLPEDVKTAVRDGWTLPPGSVFDEAEYHKSGAATEQALTDRGYAYASVSLGAEVDLVNHKATLHVEVHPGPPCTFDGYTVEGLNELSERSVRLIVDIEKGERYSTRTIRNAQHALFDLGVFDSAAIEPDLSDPKRTAVPFKIIVTESKLKRLRLGPGFLLDPLRNDVHFLASWEHRNFFGGLRRLKYELRPLVMLKPGLASPKQARPGFTTGVDFRQPSLLSFLGDGRATGIVNVTTGIVPDPVNDFRSFTTRGSIGIDRRFGDLVYGGLFYRKGFDFVTAYGDTPLPANVCIDRLDLLRSACKAQIGYFELLASVDARDDIMRPRNGYYTSLSLQYAMASKFPLAGDFADVRVQPEFRFYGPMSRKITLAFRFMTGFLFSRNYALHFPNRKAPTAGDPSQYDVDTSGDTPFWRAFFSGGASSNRGYPIRSVGLRDCGRLPNDPITGAEQREAGGDCSIQVGGASIWESSLELRFEVLTEALEAVIFADASDVSRNVFDIRLDYPHLSVGPGLRYFTPIGPIRVDFGYRVPGMQRIGGDLDPRENPKEFSLGFKGPFALHLSIGEAF
jgi:outer membrane protein assembly factor BamA